MLGGEEEVLPAGQPDVLHAVGRLVPAADRRHRRVVTVLVHEHAPGLHPGLRQEGVEDPLQRLRPVVGQNHDRRVHPRAVELDVVPATRLVAVSSSFSFSLVPSRCV